MSVRAWQRTLVAVGALGMAVGGYLVLGRLLSSVPSIALWALGPVAVHDLVIAPAAVAGAWVGRRILPRPVWAAVTGGVVATAALVLVSLTVLRRPGALEDNPSLLDRSYGPGLLAALAVVWVVAGVLAAVALHRARPQTRAETGAEARPGAR